MTPPTAIRRRLWLAAWAFWAVPAAYAGATPTGEESQSAAETLVSQADAAIEQGGREGFEQAETQYRQALKAFVALGDRAWQAGVWQRLGRLYRKYLEDQRQALACYRTARQLYAQLGDGQSESVVLNNLGRVHFQLGEMTRAVEHWQQALPLKREIGDLSGEAAALSNLGLASRYRGEFQQALTYYDRALDVLVDHGNPVEIGRAYNNRGRFYDSLGQTDRALADLHRARAIGHDVGDPSLQAMALTAIGRIQLDQGEVEAALGSLRAAMDFRTAAGRASGRAVTLRSLGEVYEALGRLDEAEAVQREALGVFEQLDLPRDRARVHDSLGRLGLATGRFDDGARQFLHALDVFRDLDDPEGQVAALSGLARASRLQGDLAAARDRVGEALSRIERLRYRAATPDLRAAFLARHQEDVGFLVDVLMEMHRREPAAGHDRRAFEAHELSRARALFDRIEVRPRDLAEGGDPEADAHVVQAAEELELLSRQHRILRQGSATPERLQELEVKLDEAVRKLWSLRGAAALADDAQPDGKEPILDVVAIRRDLLDAESILLAYRLGEERSFAWLLTASSFDSFELPAGDEIASAVRRAHQLLRSSHRRETRAMTRQTLDLLSSMLLKPVAKSLGGRRLLIVADGALHYLPFAALPAPDRIPGTESVSGSTPLVSSLEIVTLPSASSVASLRKRSAGRSWNGSVSVVAGGAPYASREAESIRVVARDAAAVAVFASTPESVGARNVGRYRILHLAAHGEIHSERPELSRLIFESPDSVLYADQIAALDIPADLVVLSACETALGPVVRGEGFVGLPQGFFQAGASSVLVSLWQVDDRATAALMERFYEGLLRRGLPAPAALRRAQTSLMESSGWKAPYFWAGFVLLGDWR